MVGVIGLGIMGGSIARNLVAAGQKVCGYDPDPDRQREAEANGVEVLDSAAAVAARASIALTSAVAARASIALTSLPSVAALQSVTDELAGLASSDVDGLIVAELSTLPIDDKLSSRDRLAEHGIVLLDCPLSGTGAQAAIGDLVVYASGDEASCKACEKVFLGFGRACPYLGDFGNGTKMKFVANLLVAVNNVATAEAMLLGVRSGLDAQTLYEVVGAGAGNSRVFELRGPLMVSEEYEPATMKLEVWQKDMKLIREFAEENGVSTPLFAASAPVYSAAVEAGRGHEDTAAVYEVLKTLSDSNA